MDIDLARTFIEIVRSGSLVAAAEHLHVTQTAISARVQKLEQLLGCQLFVRSRNGASLTADGKGFVAYANQLVHTWEAARRDLHPLAMQAAAARCDHGTGRVRGQQLWENNRSNYTNISIMLLEG